MRVFLIVWTVGLCFACHKKEQPITGKYALEVDGLKNISRGEMLIIGEPGDYFGKISLFASRTRVYEIGLKEVRGDSIYFILPGKGGYLKFKGSNSEWHGYFKYFGLQASLKAIKVSEDVKEFAGLVNLKPIGQGTISTLSEESFPSYDNFNNILYFCRDNQIYSSAFNGNNWESPVKLSFSEKYNDTAPFQFNQGNSMLFTSNRSIEPAQTKKNVWKVDKVNDRWHNPTPLPYPINIDSLGDYHASITKSGNIYFVSYNRQSGFGRSDIYRASKISTGEYEVMNLGATINSEKSEADIYVHSEEKYIIFASTDREDTHGSDDLYISYKQDNDWSKPRNLGPITNSYAYEYGAWVDEKNNHLYFNSYRRGTSDIYRINLEDIKVFE